MPRQTACNDLTNCVAAGSILDLASLCTLLFKAGSNAEVEKLSADMREFMICDLNHKKRKFT